MKVIDNKFEIGQTVYLKTDTEQLPRIVYKFIVYQNSILYALTQGVTETEHYDFEMAEEKNELIKL